jgi:diguanylate cyclase (GGDEF)-like protein
MEAMPIDDLDESMRLAVLGRIDRAVLRQDPVLQRIVRLAVNVGGSPFGAVHLIDQEFQDRIAFLGVPYERVPRGETFCRLVVEGDETIETLDATVDQRFAHSPHARGPGAVRHYAATPLRTGGAPIGTLCVWGTEAATDGCDLAALEDLAAVAAGYLQSQQALTLMAEAAATDALTGLPNRRMIDDDLTRRLADRQRRGTETSVLFLDLDGFKPVNDRHGHAVGDEVLVAVADRLRSLVRSDESVGRLGGDEFLVALTGGAADAEVAADRIHGAFATPIETSAGPCRVGVSIGTATAAEHVATAADLLLRADAAMYLAKQARGRLAS